MAELLLRLERDALPFLARFETRDAILRELEANPEIAGPASPTTRAIIAAARGQVETARDLLRMQIQASTSLGRTEYVQGIAEKIGLGRIDA